ncbi:hypothetical protein ACHAW6_011923 [Cyclotella cf. meneghiniana]
MHQHYRMQPPYQCKQSCNHPAIPSPHQAMPLFPNQNVLSWQNRCTTYQVSLTICYPWLSLQMLAVKCFSPDRGGETQPPDSGHSPYKVMKATLYPVMQALSRPHYLHLKPIASMNNSLTSEHVRCFIKRLEYDLMGYLDQRRQGTRSTKSSSATTTPDPIKEPQQLSLNDKTNMVFINMVDIQGQLTDQTGPFPIASNRGNNYVVIFYTVYANHIKSYPIQSCH